MYSSARLARSVSATLAAFPGSWGRSTVSWAAMRLRSRWGVVPLQLHRPGPGPAPVQFHSEAEAPVGTDEDFPAADHGPRLLRPHTFPLPGGPSPRAPSCGFYAKSP
jgi:hypothetical protein